MKRKLSALAIALSLVISITGCGGNSSSGDSTASGSTTSASTASTSAESSTSTKPAGFDFAKYQGEYTPATDVSKSPAAALDRKDTLVIGMTEPSGIFNVLLTTNSYDWYASYTMFDYNVDVDFDGKPMPGATDYKISDDGLTYTFTIKDGVKFWDGTPATAADLEFAYYLIADPKYDGAADVMKTYIKGVDAYKNGSAATIEGLKVVDDKTLQITVDKPSGATLLNLQVPVMQKKHYDTDFKKGDLSKVKAKNGSPMGTGQYKFVSYKAGQEIKLEANPDYFKGAPKIKNVIFSITPEGQELPRVIAGETDVDMATVSPDNMKLAKDSNFIDIMRFPTNGYGYVGLNLLNPKFKDVKVRQAMMYALNRAAVVEKVYGEYARVVNIPESNVSWAYDDDGVNTYDYDLDKAGQLLDEAGWKLNADGKREKDGQLLSFKFSCMSPHAVTDILLPVMKDDYAKLGIDVTVENLDWPTLYEKATSKKLEAYFMATGATADPDGASMSFVTNGQQNYWSYSNTKVDQLYKDGVNELTFDKRKPIYKEIYKTLNEELPMLYVYQRSDMWVANARVQGYEASSFREFFYNVYKLEIK
jgi:peptide/nickel transport system substrate-binding protein